MAGCPKIVFVFSGKRKAGKDYITDRLLKMWGEDRAVVIRLSAPIKKYWSELHGLDYSELLGTGDYKEKFRQDMIRWSEEKRAEDYGYFCRLAVEMATGRRVEEKIGEENRGREWPVWIVADARRTTDLKWLRETFGGRVFAVRIEAGDDVRRQRGWVFQAGVDNAESECGLDNVNDWNLVFSNSGNNQDIQRGMEALTDAMDQALRTS